MFRSNALWLGSEANQKAEAGDYYGAIDLFSKAIELCPYDYRFYLNRAFCYEKIELYHWSLEDSEEAIRLNRSIEKCYLRKARALMGLKEYTKAEITYQLILQMNPNSNEAKEDSIELRFRALKDMGFDKQNAIKGAKMYETIRSAIDGLLSQSVQKCNQEIDNNFKDENYVYEEIENRNFVNFVDNHKNESNLSSKDSRVMTNNNKFIDNNEVIPSNGVQCIDNKSDKSVDTSDNGVTDDKSGDKTVKWADIVAKSHKSVPKTADETKVETKRAKKREKPTNIWGYNGLRVERVNVDNKKAIIEQFATFGKVMGVEPVSNRKNSVWIYYDNPNSPIEAIASTQATIHPNINYYHKGQTQPLKVYFAATNEQKDLKFCRPKHPENDRGECYYWRTTTCLMENCRLLHLPINKHIDAQVWMKDTEGKPV